MKNTVQRNRFLYDCAERGITYEEVCEELKEAFLTAISSEDWTIWVDYYYPMVCDNPIYKSELINNNRTLSWLTRRLSDRHTKKCIS